jgi:hypothetical protein
MATEKHMDQHEFKNAQRLGAIRGGGVVGESDQVGKTDVIRLGQLRKQSRGSLPNHCNRPIELHES